jgi:hypothetical protein
MLMRGIKGIYFATISEFEGSSDAPAHWLMGCKWPQSRHRVVGNWVRQLGQTAPVWKVSNACPQLEHFQYVPAGGAVLQLGH